MIFNEYWFITSYIILIFLTPILNPIKNESEKNIVLYILFFLIVGNIMPIIKNSGLPDIFNVGVIIPPYLKAGYLKNIKRFLNINWNYFSHNWNICGVFIISYVAISSFRI